MTDRITYTSQPDNATAIRLFIGGSFPPCPMCNDKGSVYDHAHDVDRECIQCASRLLPIPTKDGVKDLDWGDAVVRLDDGTFDVVKGGKDGKV